MKKTVVNIMATTGITLIILALIGILYGAEFLCISGVLQSFGANIVIHLGFLLTRRFESNYAILEIIVDISYTIVVLIVFGFIFHWYISTPIWILAIMAMTIYWIGCFINIFRIREEIKIINELLQNRNTK